MEKQIITKQAVHQVLRDFWRQHKHRPYLAILSYLLPAIGSVFVFFIPPLVIAKLINIFIKQGKVSFEGVLFYIILFGSLWLIGEIFWRMGQHFFNKFKAKSINSLSRIAFDRLLSEDYAFYANNFTGSLTKKALSFSNSFDAFSSTLNFKVVNNLFPILFAIVILWRYSFWIPAILVAMIIFAILVALPIIHRRAKFVVLRHDASSKMVGRLSDSITNILAIKSFTKEQREQNIYGEHINKYTKAYQKAADFQNISLDTILTPIYIITNVIGLLAAIFFVSRFNLEVGTIVVIFSYFALITRIFWEINEVYRSIESSVTEAAEFTQLFIDLPKVQDIPHADSLKINKADICFKEINFRYPDGQSYKDLLNNFNLKVKHNQKVGLVGPSGGGKTTITKIFLRFVDLQSGQITIDKQDISKVTQTSLRKTISYVPQDPLLFHRTLLENISYGNDNVKEEDVIRAAKLAHAHEFIAELPKGYQTLVGERGIKLSGGQRQRIAIARAILKNAPIIVLDEATSSLDSESEKYIQKSLWELMKNKTAFIIAHRLSTIKHLDRIIVINEGKIVQDGTHEELIKEKNGLYFKLWSHQSDGFLMDRHK